MEKQRYSLTLRFFSHHGEIAIYIILSVAFMISCHLNQRNESDESTQWINTTHGFLFNWNEERQLVVLLLIEYLKMTLWPVGNIYL